MAIVEKRGNLVEDSAEVLVNTVNVTGSRGPTMGKGLALDFARKWPAIVEPYKAACMSGELAAGRCCIYPLPASDDLFSAGTRRFWAAFCTKNDWRQCSEYRWISSGLTDLVHSLTEGRHASVAMSPLGCGYGGLAWSRVRPMIEQAFSGLPVELRLYLPPAS